MADNLHSEFRKATAHELSLRNWHAFLDQMPPERDNFYVFGEVLVANPGVDPLLLKADTKEGDARTLLLDLVLVQSPGSWPPAAMWKPVRFEEMACSLDCRQAGIRHGERFVAEVPVKVIS